MQGLLDKIYSELKGAWRFRRYALIAAWAACMLGWFVVYVIPDQFTSYARVNVDTRTALGPLLEGIAVRQDVEAQLNLMRQALLGRANLDKVATQVGLDRKAVTPEDRDELITGISERITIALETPTIRDPRIPNTLYRIAYEDNDRQNALKVVDTLLNSFVEDTMSSSGTASAQRFLREQIADYDRRLADAENRLAEFKKKNFGLVPGAQGDHFSRLTTETQEVKRLQGALGIAMSRKAELQRQLRGESVYVPSSGVSGSSRSSAGSNAQGAPDTTARIQEAQARLDDMLLRFTDKHPDVVAARETIKQLQVRQAEEIAALKRGDPGAAAMSGASSNPVYQNILMQLNQVDVQIAEINVELRNRRSNETELRQMVDTAPEVEAEYARLTRDYDVTKSQYNNLLERLEKARVSGDAEQTGVIRFNIVDPPTVAFTPTFPNRPILLTVVLLVGLAVGGSVAYLMHLIRPVFSSENALIERTGLPVLGVVTRTWVEKYRAQMRAGLMRYAVASGLLVFAFVAVLLAQEGASAFLRKFIG
jgi:polysaccharide chain length determinant protein (PEP-CTERM system associated)